MKNLFERTSSNWVRYSEYEWRAAEDANKMGNSLGNAHKEQ